MGEEDGYRGGQRAVFIDVESGGRPVRAPYPIGGPLNPGGPTPRRRLYNKLDFYKFNYIIFIKSSLLYNYINVEFALSKL